MMPDSTLETLLAIARRHRKIIDYYNWTLNRMTMPEAERERLKKLIVEEERALAEIGRLAGLPLAVSPAEVTASPPS